MTVPDWAGSGAGSLRELDPCSYEHDAAVETETLPLWREAFWPLERMCLHLSPVYYGFGVPHGKGEPVLVVPAFLSSDLLMLEMRLWLRRIGYAPFSSDIILNADCPNETAKLLTCRLLEKNQLNM